MHPRFEPLSFEQANPFITALMQGQKFGQQAIGFPYELQAKQAQAASQLAYANLMGPQFLAKLMNNPDFVASMTPEEFNAARPMLIQAGMGQGTGNGFLDSLNQTKGSGHGLMNPYLPRVLENHQQGSRPTQQANLYPEDPNEGQVNRPPGYVAPSASTSETNANPKEKPRGIIDLAKQGVDWVIDKGTQNPNQSLVEPPITSTGPVKETKQYFERAGEAAGIKRQGEKLGEIRADEIKDLNTRIEGGMGLADKSNHLKSLVMDPVFMNMRTENPYFQSTQLKLLSKNGTKEQQQAIGDFMGTTNAYLADTIATVPGGGVLKGATDISQNMKVSDNDTFDTIIGKIKAGDIFRELNMQRSKLAVKYMVDDNLNKADALIKADKQLNSQKIVDDVNKSLDYKITVISNKTGKKEEISISEARKRKAKGV